MGRARFTPGPWTIEHTSCGEYTQPFAIVRQGPALEHPEGHTVISANEDYHQHTGQAVLFLDAYDADLRLAAAAPELYAACKALSDFQAEYQRNALDAMPGNEHYSFKLVAIVESARQALAAADGGGE